MDDNTNPLLLASSTPAIADSALSSSTSSISISTPSLLSASLPYDVTTSVVVGASASVQVELSPGAFSEALAPSACPPPLVSLSANNGPA